VNFPPFREITKNSAFPVRLTVLFLCSATPIKSQKTRKFGETPKQMCGFFKIKIPNAFKNVAAQFSLKAVFHRDGIW
jgi:hypothetical protein